MALYVFINQLPLPCVSVALLIKLPYMFFRDDGADDLLTVRVSPANQNHMI